MESRAVGRKPLMDDRNQSRETVGDASPALRRPASWLRLHLPTLVAGGIGLMLSLIAAFAVGRWEARVTRVEFEGLASTELIVLQNGINEYLSRLVALRTLFESANEEITRSEFEVFSGRLLENHPGLLRVGWLPKVYARERADYEAAAVNDGLAGFQINPSPRTVPFHWPHRGINISRSTFPPSPKPLPFTGWTIRPIRCGGRRWSVRGTMTRSRHCPPDWFTIRKAVLMGYSSACRCM
jgi:CHASE domain